MGKLLRFCLFSSICTLIFTVTGCGSAVSIDDGGLSSSGNSPHADDQVIIQTRLDGEHLDIFTLGQPLLPDVSPHVFTQEERARDYLAGRSDSTLGRNINGNIYRYPINWNMSTDQGTTTGSRVSLDGGDGAYITDYAVESVAGRVTLPTADGTYYYDLAATNTNGYGPVTSRHTYTRSGNEASITWRDPAGNLYLLYSGAPLASYTIGFGFLINNTFGAASESVQDSRYTGTWTVTQNLNGIEGTTGQFDLRRIGITNLQVTPAEFNPAASEEATITGDVVALPTSTELTPDGWSLSGPVNWRIEIKDPLAPANNVRVFSGSSAATSPGANGKIADFSQSWDGTDTAGQPLLNATYPLRVQSTGDLSSGNILSKEVASEVRLGNRAVLVKNLEANPEDFNPEDGESTTITFSIEAVGFDSPNLSWQVDAVQGEAAVYSFPDGEAIGVSEKDVTLVWDGIGVSGPVSGPVEYRIRAIACDNEVMARESDPIRNRVLFQTDGGSCTFTDVVKAVILGNPFLLVQWEESSIPPSFLYQDVPVASTGPESKTTVKVTYVGADPVEIRLSLKAVEDSGGHVESTHTGERPLGELIGLNETYTMETNQSRVFNYTAPNVAGEYELKVEIVEGEGSDEPEVAKISVEVPGLVAAEEDFVFQGETNIDLIGSTPRHPGNHYVTPRMLTRIVDFSRRFQYLAQEKYTHKGLWFNDMSLPMGGQFNAGTDLVPSNWYGTSAHAGHQKGIEADMGSDENVFPAGLRDPFIEKAAVDAGFYAHDEVDGSNNSHYHLVYLPNLNPIPFRFVGPWPGQQ